MAEVIRMPLLSDTMEEGTIVAWHKKAGDKLVYGDVIAEVETDKAVMELESDFDGTLLYVGVEEGSAVPVDAIIAIIGDPKEDVQAILASAEVKETKVSSNPEAKVEVEVEVAAPVASPQIMTNGVDHRIKASPLAKKMALDAGVELASLKGSGDGGRVIKRDVEAFVEQSKTAAPATKPSDDKTLVPSFSYSGEEQYEEVAISQMRKTIARRLGESKFSAPHFYLTIEINMEKAMETRVRINEISPVKISFNDLVIKAAAVALTQHPKVNSSWLGDRIRTNHFVNIGVAVAVEEGLLVPVIRQANMKSLSQIKSEIKVLAGKAKERKLSGEEMSGNTFTISNLGMFGIEEFTAIINPPDACIMAVGSIVEKPVVRNGEIVVGQQMKVTLSCDHRVVDGATGAQFLKTFKEILEDPIRMIV